MCVHIHMHVHVIMWSVSHLFGILGHCLTSTVCGHAVLMLQVFHVPLEERRYTSEPASFGAESPQASIVREIMEKTGCAIEMSQAKDQSLTIMVTGRPSAVIEAKRLINLRLHTQVSRSAVLWLELPTFMKREGGGGGKGKRCCQILPCFLE